MSVKVLQKLIEAKRHSDAGRYGPKNSILASLLREDPLAFRVQRDGHISSLSHPATGFRIHMETAAIPVPDRHSAWLAVPSEAAAIAKKAKDQFVELRIKAAGLPSDSQVWLQPETGEVHLSLDYRTDRHKLQEIERRFKQATVAPHGLVPNEYPNTGWILVKRAGDPILSTAAQLVNYQPGMYNTSLTGPNPLAATLAGGLLGAGLGYGVGALGSAILPNRYFDKSVFRRNAALIGAGLGTTPGLLWALSNYQGHPTEAGQLAAILSSWPHTSAEKTGIEKDAALDQGLMLAATLPSIPKDEFGDVVWQDNRTPLGVRAATAGLLEAASHASGRDVLSPWDIARVTATGAATGLIVGKTLGALAGLRPEAQNTLQQVGIWGSVLSAVIPNAFPNLR